MSYFFRYLPTSHFSQNPLQGFFHFFTQISLSTNHVKKIIFNHFPPLYKKQGSPTGLGDWGGTFENLSPPFGGGRAGGDRQTWGGTTRAEARTRAADDATHQ